MAIIGKGPVPKKKATSKIGTNKEGQTVAAKGYNMALVRKQNEPATRTKTIAGSPAGTKVTTPVGIYVPKPVAPAKKVEAAPNSKKYGKTTVGKAIDKVKDAVTPDKTTFKMKGRGKGAGPLKCFKYN
jgi:hypothetical protein